MLKTEDLKTAYLKSEDSKYAFMCWEPQKVVGSSPDAANFFLFECLIWE